MIRSVVKCFGLKNSIFPRNGYENTDQKFEPEPDHLSLNQNSGQQIGPKLRTTCQFGPVELFGTVREQELPLK